MTFTAAHNFLSLYGAITSEGDSEQWTCGLRIAEGNTLIGETRTAQIDPSTTAALDKIEGDLTTWWGQVNLRFPGQVTFTGFKFNAIDINGRYVNQLVTTQRDFAAPKGGTGAGALPAQIATAVTFRTAASRGLAARGRIYLPPMAQTTLDVQGRLSDVARDGVTNATALLLTNLSNWPGVDNANDYGRVCVMSKIGLGATRRVNRLDVGDRFDVMRSRGEGFRENRSPEAVVTS